MVFLRLDRGRVGSDSNSRSLIRLLVLRVDSGPHDPDETDSADSKGVGLRFVVGLIIHDLDLRGVIKHTKGSEL